MERHTSHQVLVLSVRHWVNVAISLVNCLVMQTFTNVINTGPSTLPILLLTYQCNYKLRSSIRMITYSS